MKTDKFELQEKKFIKLEKRADELYQMKRKVQWKELEEPYQDGWELIITARSNSKDYKRINEILNICRSKGNPNITRDPSLVTKIRKNPKLSNVWNLMIKKDYKGLPYYYGPYLHSLSEYGYNQLPEDFKSYFIKVQHLIPNRWGGEPYIHYTYKVDIPEKELQVKTKRRIMTHIQDINPEILKEEAEIKAQLSDFWRTSGWNGHRYDDTDKFGLNIQRRHSKDALRKVLKSEMEDITEYKKLY